MFDNTPDSANAGIGTPVIFEQPVPLVFERLVAVRLAKAYK
jgi:hypothetical protein